MDSQLLLNGMFPPLKKFDRAIKANRHLSEQETINLYQIFCDCMDEGEAYNVQEALTGIALSYGKYFKKGKALPFLLRQVIFCLAVHCLKYGKMNQREVIEYLKAKGISISYNFISRQEFSPLKYLAMYNYDIPESIINYSGQKKGYLGVAIKNLVYQAGKYDTFCDIFGGSGAASLAVNKVDGTKYIYNELNDSVFNLIFVVTDEKLHIDLINALHTLQSYIAGGGEQYGTVDLDNELREFQAELRSKDPKKGQEDNLKRDKAIVETSLHDFETGGFDAVLATYDVYMDILSKPSNFSVKLNGKNYNRASLLELFGVPDGASQSTIFGLMSIAFIRQHLLLDEYMRTVMGESGTIWSSKTGQVLTRAELNQDYKQGRAYSYYAYFCNLLQSSSTISSDRVGHALAEIFRRYFSLKGIHSDPSSVLSVLRSDEKPTINGFCKKDFETLITNMHKALKGTVLENEDFHNILKKYNEYQNVVYYADPPYVATKGYKDKNNNVGAFNETNMEQLINSLVSSDHKFIYSCRAVADDKNRRDLRPLYKDTLKIIESVYKKFYDFIDNAQVKDFYVLAMEDTNAYTINGESSGTLKYAIENFWTIELMITNFEICTFIDVKSQKYKTNQEFIYKVYPFTEFWQMLDKKFGSYFQKN